MHRQQTPSFPVAFPVPPTKEQVIGHINSRTQQIRQLESNIAVRFQGIPAKGDLALERPRNFRMRASVMGLPGTGIDLGSNHELFWMFAEQMKPPGVHFVRHDQFDHSAARQLMPVKAEWLIESFGLTEFAPDIEHAGPYQRVPGQLEIHSQLSPEMTKITVVDQRYGFVLEQQIMDRGVLVASSRASDHQFYSLQGVVLPQHIEIQLAPRQFSKLTFSIDVSGYRINQMAGNPEQLWSMPQPDGLPLIDLANPQQMSSSFSKPMISSSPQYEAYRDSRESYRPVYRTVRQ